MRLTKDLLAGLMFLAFGLGAAIVARNYELGSLNRMGSGFFPIVIGLIIAALGVAIALRALLKPESSEPVEGIQIRPISLVSLAIIVFGFLIDDWGLIAALVALIIIASLAGRDNRPIETGIMVLVLTAIAVGIFIYALGIHLRLGPT